MKIATPTTVNGEGLVAEEGLAFACRAQPGRTTPGPMPVLHLVGVRNEDQLMSLEVAGGPDLDCVRGILFGALPVSQHEVLLGELKGRCCPRRS